MTYDDTHHHTLSTATDFARDLAADGHPRYVQARPGRYYAVSELIPTNNNRGYWRVTRDAGAEYQPGFAIGFRCPQPGLWQCDKCGRANPGWRDVCPECGADRTGGEP